MLTVTSILAMWVCLCNHVCPSLGRVAVWIQKKYRSRTICRHRPCRNIICCRVYEDRETADAVRMRLADLGSARNTLERREWARYNQEADGAPSAANLHQVRTFSTRFQGPDRILKQVRRTSPSPLGGYWIQPEIFSEKFTLALANNN